MKIIKDILRAMLALFTFEKGYTNMPRIFEIALGISVWLNIILLLYSLHRIGTF